TFTAIVAAVGPGAGTPSGNVTFTIDGVAQTPSMQLTNGRATFSTSSLPASSTPHTVQVTYGGDASFLGSNGSLTGGQKVDRANSITTVVTSNSMTPFGTPVTFTATVAATGQGVGTPTGLVTFFVDGVAQSPAVNLSGGRAS